MFASPLGLLSYAGKPFPLKFKKIRSNADWSLRKPIKIILGKFYTSSWHLLTLFIQVLVN